MIYRKRGHVVRWENGTLVRVAERGVAVEEGELFECRPDDAGAVPVMDETRVIEAACAVKEAVGEIAIERLIVVEGVAQHEYGTRGGVAFAPPQRGEGARSADERSSVRASSDRAHREHPSSAFGTFSPQRGEKAERGVRTWTEHTQRIHLSLIRAHTRALLDLGSFDVDDVTRVADALTRLDEIERDAPPRLRLAPNVTAALLPTLVGIAPPNVCIVQTAGGVDGYGAPIVEANGSWPNAYRPSYRVRPVRMPMQLRIECDVTEIERDRPVAVALLAPVSSVLRVLVDDGKRAYPSTVRIARIDAVSSERSWYPYGGGSFGAEMML
jgi:hypothetical protein